VASEILKVVEIGNSRGVRIPSRLIQRYGIEDELQLLETAEGLLLRPVRSGKLSFEESFRQMAADAEALTEADSLEGTLADGLEAEDWSESASGASRKAKKWVGKRPW
jgi:antitoxin component of MazEF toxin-antitoxin module